MRTIAFNNTKNYWSTRYSFIASCIASIKDHMVTARANPSDQNIIWKHDESGNGNNNFYGEQSTSLVGVTFNDNPSQNKQYKSLSIESSDAVNVQGINTFTTNGGPALDKSAVVRRLTERGGVVYGNIGTESRITNSNVRFLGIVESVSDLTDVFSSDVIEQLGFDGIPTAKFIKLNNIEHSAYSASNVSRLLQQDQLQEFELDPTAGLPFGGPDGGGGFFVTIFNGGVITPQPFAPAEGTPLFIGYVDINGEAPKGQIADCFVTLGSNDFEVFALNVEYSPTELDHSK